MQSNYEYVLEKCRQLAPPPARILDFGCGGGECVLAGRALGLDMFGVDIFFRDDHRDAVIANGLMGNVVFETVEGGRLPFEDARFDFVFCNMVFEHVSDIDHVLGEIARVLKPGGRFLALFPGREAIMEPHVNIPFVHWLPVKSRLRYPYMRALRKLGLGGGGAGKSPEQWAADQVDWLESYTFYRSPRRVDSAFATAGFDVQHIEEDYLRFRLSRLGLDRASRLVVSAPAGPLARVLSRLQGVQAILATR